MKTGSREDRALAMKIFTVHARSWSSAGDSDAIFVREGFSWPAFVFGPFWALWFGMWRTTIGLLLVSGAVSGIVVVTGMTDGAELAVTLALQTTIGLWANDWRRYALGRRDFNERAVVSGRNQQDAVEHYFVGGR